MKNLIQSKRESIKREDAPDVFTLMMKASESEGKFAMNDTELVGTLFSAPDTSLTSRKTGNTFLMLFAGHGKQTLPDVNDVNLTLSPDTTAHTLTATLGLLGLYQDVQEEVYQQIMAVAPTEADMVSDSMLR